VNLLDFPVRPCPADRPCSRRTAVSGYKSPDYTWYDLTPLSGCTSDVPCSGFYGVTYIKGFKDKFNIEIEAILNLICSYNQTVIPFVYSECSCSTSGTRGEHRSTRIQGIYRCASLRCSTCHSSVRILIHYNPDSHSMLMWY
jgi:hypothetical protein